MKDIRSRFPVYSKLFRLYPKQYRSHYEDEILLTAADMLDSVKTPKEKLAVWASLAFDLPVNLLRQNYEYVGGNMKSSMPSYIKRNSLISVALLAPFFLALIANGIDKMVNNNDLSSTWVWHSPAIILWVFYLPALALIISLASYGAYVFKGNDKNKAWLKRAIDIIHSWPVLIVGFISLGILLMVEFHDSTQCIASSPIHAIAHSGQTLKCVENNRAIIPRHDFNL